jgi:uncharacterized membrane protein YhaH (DUF805 family)
MNFIEAIQAGFRQYGSASGRARRSEFWYWTLFSIIVSAITAGVDYLVFPGGSLGPVQSVANLALLLPSWAVSIRRLHDINRTGYWVLIAFTVVGILLLIYWACLKGTDGDNDFGPDPLRSPAA